MKITKEMIQENTVFHCNTEDKANELLGKLDILGYKWVDGSRYLDCNNYNYYKENTCYYSCMGSYSDIGFYKINGYKIIEYVLDKDIKFTMDDIKDGFLIELRNGDKYLCCSDNIDEKIFVSDEKKVIYYSQYYNFDVNTGTSDLSNYDIVKVYGRSLEPAYLLSFKITNNRILLWEREVEVTEMTMEEICKIVGKNVKIIK